MKFRHPPPNSCVEVPGPRCGSLLATPARTLLQLGLATLRPATLIEVATCRAFQRLVLTPTPAVVGQPHFPRPWREPQPTTVSHDAGCGGRPGTRMSRCTPTGLSHATGCAVVQSGSIWTAPRFRGAELPGTRTSVSPVAQPAHSEPRRPQVRPNGQTIQRRLRGADRPPTG